LGHATSIALVVAVADNGVIGASGKLPWHLPDDLKHFKQVTMGKPVLMGRRTYLSIGRALPGRRNLVLTRSPDAVWPDVEAVHSLDTALARLAHCEQVCVIGGSDVFALTLPSAQCIYLTQVHAAPPGDTFFAFDRGVHWREVERIEHPADERHRYAMSFVTLRRV
jgi:dihydrofolate reductase